MAKPTRHLLRTETKRVVAERDEDGNPVSYKEVPIEWGARSRSSRDYIKLDEDKAEAAALAYYSKNMTYDDMKYKLVD